MERHFFCSLIIVSARSSTSSPQRRRGLQTTFRRGPPQFRMRLHCLGCERIFFGARNTDDYDLISVIFTCQRLVGYLFCVTAAYSCDNLFAIWCRLFSCSDVCFHTCQISLILTETPLFWVSLRFSLIFIHFSLIFRSSLNYAVF